MQFGHFRSASSMCELVSRVSVGVGSGADGADVPSPHAPPYLYSTLVYGMGLAVPLQVALGYGGEPAWTQCCAHPPPACAMYTACGMPIA
jgi:hypothetical protein